MPTDPSKLDRSAMTSCIAGAAEWLRAAAAQVDEAAAVLAGTPDELMPDAVKVLLLRIAGAARRVDAATARLSNLHDIIAQADPPPAERLPS